jgi:hypothetical protein
MYLHILVVDTSVLAKSNMDRRKYVSYYSLRSIILFTNVDVSRHILVIDISVLAKSNMGRREY